LDQYQAALAQLLKENRIFNNLKSLISTTETGFNCGRIMIYRVSN
jgi:hypothetical protein